MLHINWDAITLLGVFNAVLISVLIPIVLLIKKENSTSTVAWIMAILILPILGGLLFLVFGINRVERRAAHKVRATRAIGRQMPGFTQYQLMPGEADAQQQQLLRLATKVSRTVPISGNHVEVLGDTRRTLSLIAEAIQSAQNCLHLEYYIWQPDRTGTRLRDMLIQKAREGVRVRFLYDQIGSMWLSRRFLKPMRAAGIEVAPFLPGQSWRERWSLNLRNHRKIAVVDGRIAFTGGMNIGDEYLGLNPDFGFWRDTDLRLTGPIVLQLQQVFAEDWYYATGEELTGPQIFPPPEEMDLHRGQVLAGGPAGDVNVFHPLMFTAINEARHTLRLATSYFVPPFSLVTALESAAHRGVRVQLLVPGKSAYQWTVWAGQSLYATLLAAGVEIYEYRGGLLHSKTMTIDGNWSMVGSPNFDARSLFLNFEVAVALYDSKLAAQLEEQFDQDLKHSERIVLEAWLKRPIRHRLRENICHLFSPVL